LSANILNSLKSAAATLKGGKILYYPGCMTKHYITPVFNNYKAVLSDFGIGFITLDELSCCGSPLLSAGYAQDFEEVKKKNLGILKKQGVTKIITNCPHCYQIFKKQYCFDTEHISQTLAEHKHKVSYKNKEEIAYHDPCLLAKKNNIAAEPRSLIRQAGLKIIEPSKNKEKTFCCGAGGGLKQNYPALANKLAQERLRQLGGKKIVVSCPYCYAHLSENAGNKKTIIELSEFILEH